MKAVDGVRKYQIIIAALFLVACIGYLVAVHFLNIETEVMRDRFWKNAEPLFNGEVPVVPVMEYPPFALVFFAIPRLFADTPWGYNVAYVAEVLVFMVVGLLLVSKLAERMGHDQKKAMLVYAILMLLMLEFVVDRYDIFPAILTLASFYMFASKRHGCACLLLAVGAMTKLYPAVLFPLYLLYLAYGRQWRDAAVSCAAFLGTCVLIVGVAWLINPELITNFLSYHTDRPLQIESVPASVVYLLSMFGLTDVWIQPFADPDSFGSDNLMGSLPDAVASVMMPLMVVLILAVYAYYAVLRHRGVRDDDLRLIGLAAVAVLMLFMVANKVFSSQYLIWAIAPIAFVVASRDTGFERRLLWLSVLVLVLTQANFAYNAGYLGGGENINDLGMMVILARNVLAVWLTCMVLGGMRRPAGDAVPSPPGSDPVERRVIISRRAR